MRKKTLFRISLKAIFLRETCIAIKSRDNLKVKYHFVGDLEIKQSWVFLQRAKIKMKQLFLRFPNDGAEDGCQTSGKSNIMKQSNTEPEKCMEMEPWLAWEEQVPVCLQQVFQPSSRLVLDHMTAPRSPPEQEMVLQKLRDKHLEPDLPARDMAELACTQRTSDRVGTQEGHRVTTFVPCKDTVARMPLVVGTDRRLVLVSVVQ